MSEFLTSKQIEAFARSRVLKFKCAYCGRPTKAVPHLDFSFVLRKWNPAVCYRDECLDKDSEDIMRRGDLL